MASKGVNKVILVGNLGKDPEIRYLPSGGAIANVSVATSDSWKDKNTGEQVEKTEWHRVVVFGKLAEIVGEYLKKGSQVYFEGKLQTRKWQDQSGQDRYSTEVVVDQMSGVMQMLSGRQQGQQQQGFAQAHQQQSPAQQAPTQQQGFAPQQQQQGFAQQRQGGQQQGGYSERPMDFDDDIPF